MACLVGMEEPATRAAGPRGSSPGMRPGVETDRIKGAAVVAVLQKRKRAGEGSSRALKYSLMALRVLFTVEYSLRAAQVAVYELLDVDRKIPPISPYDKSIRVQFDALIKAFR